MIKVRAWDENNNKFWYWESGDIDNSFWDKARKHKMPIDIALSVIDINGGTIYENDIIKGELIFLGSNKKSKGNFDKLPITGIVVYDDSLDSYAIKNDAGLTPIYKTLNIEKIGNKYNLPMIKE